MAAVFCGPHFSILREVNRKLLEMLSAASVAIGEGNSELPQSFSVAHGLVRTVLVGVGDELEILEVSEGLGELSWGAKVLWRRFAVALNEK